MLDGLAEVGGGGVLHLADDESADLGRRVLLSTSLNPGVTVAVGNDLVRNIGDVPLHLGVGELATDQSDSSVCVQA